jgi:hypothetical protein
MIDMKRKGKPGMIIDYLSTGVGGMVISLVALTGFVKLTGFGQTYGSVNVYQRIVEHHSL